MIFGWDKRGDRLRLALEAGDEGVIGGVLLAENLDRDMTPERGIEPTVDDGHPAVADLRP
jgi:hypothetical protein